MTATTLQMVVWGMAIGRALIGVAPFIAAGPLSKMLGFPPSHDNATARVMARFFGVRDVGLGVLAWWAAADVTRLPFMALFQATMDAGDLSSVVIPLAKRQGIDRGALTSGAFALTGGLAWVVLFVVVSS